jgi:ATP-dependent DNA helicase RecG
MSTATSNPSPDDPGARLDSGLRYLPGVGGTRDEALSRLGIHSIRDLLAHLPRRHEDRRRLAVIRELRVGETAVVRGAIVRVRERRAARGPSVLTARLDDGTGTLDLVWFQQSYLADWLRVGETLHAFGVVQLRGRSLQIVAPEFEVETDGEDAGSSPLDVGRIVPIYDLTKGIHQRFLRRLIDRYLPLAAELGEGPADLLVSGSPTLAESYRAMHFPESFECLERARARLVFDAFFAFGTQLFDRRQAFRGRSEFSFQTTSELDAKIRSIFPFSFTVGQESAVRDIVRDLAGAEPMYRLLQGDVGTGKTAVALYALLVAVRHGAQGALMAPTEVLASQHHRTLSRYLEPYPVRIALLTGSTRPADRSALLEELAAGKIHIIVGTHALVQDPVVFRRLGLVVIDEQHRFGVRERKRLREKGSAPHILVMTATPIPRSLCMTCYGDLDLSVLRDRPLGRVPVRTRVVGSSERDAAVDSVRRELQAGRQAYFVYPLIEESETLALPAAEAGFENLSKDVFPEFRVGLLHGKLSSKEKEETLAAFRDGEIRVLVSTVVVEVGIDVPNATVLFIEDASRFGLAQLHQLRGRVGRGEHPGTCFVGLGPGAGADARERLRVFASITDGFQLAEADLRLRGPGDFLGIRQAGRPRGGLASPLEDPDRFALVRKRAEAFWSDPNHRVFRARWAPSLDPELHRGEFWGLD